MRIQFLGQAGFLISGTRSRFLIDPYLSDFVITGGYGSAELFKRNFPPPIRAEDISNIDAVFITHDHADHCDLETLEIVNRNNPNCVFIGPKPVRSHLDGLIKQRSFVEPIIGTKVRIPNGINLFSLPAAHPRFSAEDQKEIDCIGYLIKMDGVVIYHSGDTVIFNELIDDIQQSHWKIDIACLPVNGRDEKRETMGIVGNMTAAEALRLSKSIKTKWMIPMHNDLFTINQVNPAIVDLALSGESEVTVVKMRPGQEIEYKK